MDRYTRLWRSILTSSVWSEAPSIRCVWITLLAEKDMLGRVQASIPGLARLSAVSLEECAEAIRVLSEPDPWSRSKEHEGRRIRPCDGGWEVLNHGKYDRDTVDRREYKAEWARRKRQRVKMESQNVDTVSPPLSTVDTKRGPISLQPSSYILQPEETDPTDDVRPKDLTGSARAVAPEPTTIQKDLEEPLSVCPANLVERAEELKIPDEFAKFYETSEDVIREAIQEFYAYWTIGAGTGKRKRVWLAVLRQRLKEMGQQKRFAPVGKARYDAVKNQGKRKRFRQKPQPPIDRKEQVRLAEAALEKLCQ